MQTTLSISKLESESSDDEKEDEKCPVCNAIWKKSNPTLAEVRSAIKDTVKGYETNIKMLSENTMFGYCGSIATGTVGEHKPHAGMEPDIKGECGTKFDVDGFVISNQVARKIRKFRGKRWAYKHKSTRDIEKNLRKSLKSKPELEHIRGGKSGFSIVVYAANEENKVIDKGCIILIH